MSAEPYLLLLAGMSILLGQLLHTDRPVLFALGCLFAVVVLLILR